MFSSDFPGQENQSWAWIWAPVHMFLDCLGMYWTVIEALNVVELDGRWLCISNSFDLRMLLWGSFATSIQPWFCTAGGLNTTIAKLRWAASLQKWQSPLAWRRFDDLYEPWFRDIFVDVHRFSKLVNCFLLTISYCSCCFLFEELLLKLAVWAQILAFR